MSAQYSDYISIQCLVTFVNFVQKLLYLNSVFSLLLDRTLGDQKMTNGAVTLIYPVDMFNEMHKIISNMFVSELSSRV